MLEIKGPKDEKDLLGPLLQAACGAAAVVAKGKMLCDIAQSPGKLRPAYNNARIPRRASIGIHVLTAKDKRTGKLEAWSPQTQQSCETLLHAFSQLEYIAYSFVDPAETNGFQHIDVDHLVKL